MNLYCIRLRPVVTKCKTYGPESVWRPLLDGNYREILKRWKGKVSVLYTDAVADTVANTAGELVPASNFSSVGMEDLLGWVVQVHDRRSTLQSAERLFLTLLAIAALLGLWWYIAPCWILLGVAVVLVGWHSRKKTK